MMSTLLLNRQEVAALLEPAALLTPMKEAFKGIRRDIPAQRARSPLPGGSSDGNSATVLFPGLLPDIPAYTVKVHAKFPGQDPAIRGLVHLHDLFTGELLALIESSHLTAVRTAVAATVAADVLARRDAHRLAIIGAGAQGEQQVRLLKEVRRVEQVRVFDTAPFKTGLFVRRIADVTGAKVMAADSLAEAVSDADLVVCATWSRRPFLVSGMVSPGAHVTTLGADEPGKAEVSADLIEEGVFVCDDRDLAVDMGAVGNVGLGLEAVHAELGEVIAGTKTGRESAAQITVYGGVGLPWMDLLAAWQVYQRALEAGRGQRLEFLN